MQATYGKGIITPSIADEQHIVFRDRLFKAGNKRPVVWCHSAGGDANEPQKAGDAYEIMQVLVELGFAVISFDGKTSGLTLSGSPAAQHWGNDGAQARLNDALVYLRSNYGASLDPPLIFGVSMGCLLALNYV